MGYFASPEFQQQVGTAITPQFGATTGATGGLGATGVSPWLQNIGAGVGIGGILGSLFGAGRGPSMMGAASPYFQQALQQMYGLQQQLPGYFAPYMQAGAGALPQLQQQYGALISDPGAMLSKIGAGFHADPGYQFQLHQALQAANRAAAAGGMAGSPAEQAQAEQTARGLAAQGYGDYMSRALGLYQAGLGGMGGLAGMGLRGAGQLATGEMGIGANIANIFGSQAQLAAAQAKAQQEQQQQEAGGIGGLFGAGIGLIASHPEWLAFL